jgi:hypothetical protein
MKLVTGLAALLALVVAACTPRAASPTLPVPRVVTGLAPSATEAASQVAGRPTVSPSATEFMRLPLSASVILRVRAGPGTQYDTVGLMQQGETAAAVGRSEAGDWLLIEAPAVPGGVGWVSREFTAVNGAVDVLPVSGEIIAAPTLPPLAEFDLPPEATSTRLPPGAPTLTPAPAATQAPAEVGFYADTLEVDYRKPCTNLYWIASPAQAVYLDGESMLGRDTIVVCPRIPSQTYTLEVVALDGRRLVLTLTISNSGIP